MHKILTRMNHWCQSTKERYFPVEKQNLITNAEFLNYPISIGCDPEFFLVDSKTKKPVSPHEFLSGTKTEPTPVNGGAVQVDGLAVEFNIDPAYNTVGFNRNINSVMSDIRKMIPSHLEFHFTPTMWFDEDYLAKLPSHVLELGCDPDFDAYTNGAPNPRPKPLVKDGKVLRTAAGHIHIGWPGDIDVTSEVHRWNCILLAKRLDMVFKPTMSLIDFDTLRSSMYGKPGAYRPKPYGMEYRTPSNVWVPSNGLRTTMFNLTRYALGSLLVCNKFAERSANDVRNISGFSKNSPYSLAYLFDAPGMGWPYIDINAISAANTSAKSKEIAQWR